jgi:hypothetical protein
MRHVKFFTTRNNRPTWRVLAMMWTHQERAALIARHHNPNWIRDTYARITVTVVVEGLFFLLAVVGVFVLSLYF